MINTERTLTDKVNTELEENLSRAIREKFDIQKLKTANQEKLAEKNQELIQMENTYKKMHLRPDHIGIGKKFFYQKNKILFNVNKVLGGKIEEIF